MSIPKWLPEEGGQAQASEPAIAGFHWGSPVAELKASKEVKPSQGFSAKCVKDLVSVAGAGCSAFVPTSDASFARAYYATARDGRMMVESKETLFDCERFDDLASPDADYITGQAIIQDGGKLMY